MAYHPFRNPGIKVMAVLLATALWFTVAGESNVERAMRVPLELRNKPINLEIVGEAPTTVDVRVLGSSALLGRMQPGDVIAVLDLSTARAGSRIFHMRTDGVRVPYGVRVLQVNPSTIPLELEASLRRALPVVPALEGDPAAGFVVGRIIADPPTVNVVGPESHVKDMTAATTEPVSVAGATEEVRDTVTVGVLDAAVRVEESQSAAVRVEILPAPVERVLREIAVRWRNLGEGYSARVEPQEVNVTVRGRREAIEGIRAERIDAFVDLAGLGPGQYNLRVQFDPTQNVGVSAADPAVVQVTIK